MAKDRYESPLSSRYASKYMLQLFSQQERIHVWRQLWVELARAEHQLGLPITAIGYYTENAGVSLGLVIAAVVATTAVFLLGLFICMYGFRKHGREDSH